MNKPKCFQCKKTDKVVLASYKGEVKYNYWECERCYLVIKEVKA